MSSDTESAEQAAVDTETSSAATLSLEAADEAARSGGGSNGQGDKRGVPPEVRMAEKEWPTANGDYAATRATFNSKIKASNVSQLQVKWSLALPPAAEGSYVGSATSAPLVLGGTVYYTDQFSNVYAIDAATGTLRWQTLYNAPGGAPNGVAVGWGKVFAAASDKKFVALDASNGKELWSAKLDIPQYGGIGIAPIAYGGLVYISTTPVNATSQYAGGVNGTLYALEQATGKVAWKFRTIQDKNLWGHPEINSGGGAWFPPTIDTQNDRMYWGIGNPGPYPGTPEFPLGSSRPGNNLYTNSVVSLGARTGDLNWYQQEAPHDLFDLDFQNSPIIVQRRSGRDDKQLVIGSGKTGTVVAYDAKRNGKIQWRTSIGKHQNDKLQTFGAEGVDVYPGSLGGIIAPLAYASGTLYVTSIDWGRHFYPSSVEPGLIGESGQGALTALNVDDGKIRWSKDLGSTPYGSVTVVNDLVITSTIGGIILAFNRETGAEVWRTQGPNGINGPITASGDELIIPFGLGPNPLLLAYKLP